MLLLHIDAFSDRPFSGNPAAVCLLDRDRDDGWMQGVAADMNLSATAFLLSQNGGFRLRWFTPAKEIDLCGHATLATAHALWSERVLSEPTARFHTRSGVLTASRSGDRIFLDFPSTPPEQSAAPAGLLESIDVKPRYVGRSKFDYLVEVESEDVVRAISPDFAQLKKIEARGLIVTARSREYDFVSRFFAPAVSIDEDPVTGSAHCALAPYWAERLKRNEFRAYQASKRGGQVDVVLKGDRVQLGGKAVTVARGELLA